MYEGLNSAFLVASVAGLLWSFSRALPTIIWSLRAPGGDGRRPHILELRVGDEVITINVSEIDREDSGKIKRAAEAVRNARRLAA